MKERNRSSRRQQRIMAITNHIRSKSSGPERIRHKQQSEARPSQQVRTRQPRTHESRVFNDAIEGRRESTYSSLARARVYRSAPLHRPPSIASKAPVAGKHESVGLGLAPSLHHAPCALRPASGLWMLVG